MYLLSFFFLSSNLPKKAYILIIDLGAESIKQDLHPRFKDDIKPAKVWVVKLIEQHWRKELSDCA